MWPSLQPTPEELTALWLSLKIGLWCTALIAVPGIVTGWLLARIRFPGKALVDGLVHLPLVLPPVVPGYLLLLLLGRQGPIGRWLYETWGIALAFTYLVFLVANVISGNGRHFFPRGPGFFTALWAQLRWYAWGSFTGAPHPHHPTADSPFNVLQAVTYAGVMYGLMPVLILSGLVYLYPELAPDRLFGFDGLLPIALLHYLAAMSLLLFLLTHIYLGTTGQTVGQMFRAMISGWHTR